MRLQRAVAYINNFLARGKKKQSPTHRAKLLNGSRYRRKNEKDIWSAQNAIKKRLLELVRAELIDLPKAKRNKQRLAAFQKVRKAEFDRLSSAEKQTWVHKAMEKHEEASADMLEATSR